MEQCVERWLTRVKNPSNSNTEPQVTSIFRRIVADVFDEYFGTRGASRVNSDCDNVIRYHTDRWFCEVLYLPLDGPRYSPRVEVGVIPDLFTDPRRNRIDILHTTPVDSCLRRYNFTWRYANEREAREAFSRVRDEVLAVYTDAFIVDIARLELLLTAQCAELDQAWEKEIGQHNIEIVRGLAENAFRDGDYDSVVRQLAAIPLEELTTSDRRKLMIARKRLGDEG
jgi:hypothetical protein